MSTDPFTEAHTAPSPEECPGHLEWSAFGATYMDTVCSTALVWSEGQEPPSPTLCDGDDDLRPADIPCPWHCPEQFMDYLWGDEHVLLWAADESPLDPGTVIHFHDGQALRWSATHPTRGEEWVLARELLDEEEA